jgi:tetratricopeptide (TPR) repeat protein
VTPQRQKAESFFLRAIALDAKSLGPESPELGTDLNNLGLLYVFTKRYDEALKTCQRALAIRTKAFGETDPLVVETMGNYASALHGLHRDTEAKQMEDRMHAISAKAVTVSR